MIFHVVVVPLTVPDDTTYADALAVLDRCGGRAAFRPSVVALLREGESGRVPETPASGDSRLARATYRLIGSRRDAMEGAAAAARERGYVVLVQDAPVTGQARETARAVEGNVRRPESVARFADRGGEDRDIVERLLPGLCFGQGSHLGLDGQIAIVAMRDIEPGEEVTIDYAMCDGSPYDEFDCACGTALCRGRVTGEDWRDPALWKRYQGHFWEDMMLPVPGRRIPQPSLLRSHPPTKERIARLLALENRELAPPIEVEEEPMVSLVGRSAGSMQPRYRFPGVWF